MFMLYKINFLMKQFELAGVTYVNFISKTNQVTV